MNLDRIYDSNFYSSTTEGSLQAARRVLGTLWAKRQFASVVDVGCGTGTWLLAARELGATSLQGIEGAHIPDGQFVVPYESIVRADLDQPLESTGRFDLCLCLEVAEHLPKSRGESLVDDLTKLSPVVVFSAATPFQGGNGHVNEMWPEYWAQLFAGHGYLPWTGPREALWTDRSVPWWYRQNLLVFVHEAEWNALLAGEKPPSANLLTAIHPENYLWCIRRERGELATSFDFDLDLYYATVQGTGVPFGYGPEFSVELPEPLAESIFPGTDLAPLVSVIIPCYRQAHYLPQAVRSVLDQTLQRVEVIVVDDGSPDDPRGQLGEMAEDPRVTYIRQENAGVGHARNTGAKASRGMFLNFLDADDWLAPAFCERMCQALSANNDLGFVYCDLRHAVEGGPSRADENYSVGGSRQLVNGNILPSLLVGGYFPPHTVLVRRSVLNQVGLFDAELGGHADWDLWLRISASGYPAQYVDEKLVHYRIHPASMSRNAEHMRSTRVRTLRKLIAQFPGKVAEGIHELCRSAEEQYEANQFLHGQLLAFGPSVEEDGMERLRGLSAALLAEHAAHEEVSRDAGLWRSEVARMRGLQERFDQYFAQTQQWMAAQAEAKNWHEERASYWKSEADRLVQRNRALNRSRVLPRAIAWVRHFAGIEPRKS